MTDFIEKYKCSDNICDDLIEFFKQNKVNHSDGMTLQRKINKNVKESTDLCVSINDNKEPVQNYIKHLWNCLEKYSETYPSLNKINVFGIHNTMNIQHYKIGGGFKAWHCERAGTFDASIKRVLVFTTYLNTVSDGGTMFKYQNYTESAVKGKTIIFPSDWTHTHKGQISNTKEKIIVTGWFSHLWDI